MKFLIILALAAAASAAKLDKVYLPPNARASSGATAGLQAPGGYSGGSAGGGPKNQAEILKMENEADEQGFRYAYETSDGTKAEAQGKVIPGAKPEEGSLQVSGSYSYIGEDGQTYTVTYTADENGFQAQGAHLPTPPPIPEEILKSLQLTAGNGGQYSSQKSSYDADNAAGYHY
ncbi:hypothetical protein JYU34_014096 [Plutella xylostella]|uniref:Cuticular protein n=1 Tax=Plutella xylostella TaxID=51655 RepID=A0ABQ7Q7J7_PLUXY|nr:hypothetical protein JYU34_014096 [Plutella xylostella]